MDGMLSVVSHGIGTILGLVLIGGWEFVNEQCDTDMQRGREYAPGFLHIDGGVGGGVAAGCRRQVRCSAQ
jgi:hypothetical protein